MDVPIVVCAGTFVKLQSNVQALAFGLGVDFVFPLSQDQPHQNIQEGSILEVLNLTHKLIPSPLPPSSTDINPTTPMLTLYDQTLFYPSIFC